MLLHLILKAKKSNDQNGKILCPRFIKTVKKMIYWPYPAFRWNHIMTGATVSTKNTPLVLNYYCRQKTKFYNSSALIQVEAQISE